MQFKVETMAQAIAVALTLVLVYLVVSNWTGSVAIVNAVGSNLAANFRVLQARG